MQTINIQTAKTAELVAFYNEHAAVPVKKFADRKTAEKRVRALILEITPDETISEEDEADLSEKMDQELADQFNAEDHDSIYAYSVHKQVKCPHCGVHLSNGIGEHLQEVNGKAIKHSKYQFECLGCGEEFGPSIKGKTPSNSNGNFARGPRPAMKESLKIDRTVTCLETKEVFGNVFQLCKAHREWLTSAQGDRLSKTLYNAAKQGQQVTVKVGEHNYRLVNVVVENDVNEEADFYDELNRGYAKDRI